VQCLRECSAQFTLASEVLRTRTSDALGHALIVLLSEDPIECRDFVDAATLFGAIDGLVQFLGSANKPAELVNDVETPYLSDIVKLALRLLREVAYHCPALGERLATESFMKCVCVYLTVCETFQMAELLLEEFLVCRRSTVDFEQLAIVPGLIPRLTPGQLAWFCRLASASWMEPEDRVGDGQQLRSMALLKQRHLAEVADVLG